MSIWRPSPAEERWLVLAARLRTADQAAFFAARTGGWRRVRTWSRLGFLVLGLSLASTMGTIAKLLNLPLWVAGCALVVSAEALMIKRRLFACGIEEALTLVGLCLIAWKPLEWLARGGHAGWMAGLIAALLLIAGLRLLNSLLTTLAAIASSLVVALIIKTGGDALLQLGSRPAGLYCFVVAALALGLGARVYRRPAHDEMLDRLVIALPVVGYLWLSSEHGMVASWEYLRSHPVASLEIILMPLSMGLAALGVGLARRVRAPLIAFALCMACVVFEVRELGGLSLQAKLILGGALGLAAAVVLDRILRRPRRGITSHRLTADEDVVGLMELAGAGSLGAQTQAAPVARGFEGGGGKFGGGGAGGKY